MGCRLLAISTLPVPRWGIEFSPILRWFRDVEGDAVDSSQQLDRQALRMRLDTVFQRRFLVNIFRTWLNGNADYDGVRDRDAFTLAADPVF